MKLFNTTAIICVLATMNFGNIHAQRLGSFSNGVPQNAAKAKNYIGLKPTAPIAGAKQVSVQATATNGYVAGGTHNVYFSFNINNTDFEYGDSISLTFPAGVTINSVSNSDVFGPAFDPGGAPEAFNGINGQTVSWGDNDNIYGGITSQGNVYEFNINLTFEASINGDIPVVLHLSGDGFGAAPGDVDLTFLIAPDLNPQALVQVIHNSADLAAAQVDIRLDGVIPNVSLDDMAFRSATDFLTLPAGTSFELSINAASSVDASSPLLAQMVTLDPGQTYIVVAQGIASASGYAPAPPLAFAVYPTARVLAADLAQVDVLMAHNATDAPNVDINETLLMASLSENLAYGSFDGYVSLDPDDYTIEVAISGSGNTVQYYNAPLATLGLDGAAITVLASGFVNPSANSNGESFGLWVATSGGGGLIPLQIVDLAQIQVIHNSADLALATVDVRINGALPEALDDITFRSATNFMTLAAGEALNITVHEANSVDASNPIYELSLPGGLSANEKYIAIAQGIDSEFSYQPGSNEVPFGITIFAGARSDADEGNTAVLVYHGATDAPTVSVNELSVPVPGLVSDLVYNNFTPYIELANANYVLELTQSSNEEVIATYAAALQTLGLTGQAITVLASGFVLPENNSDGPGFGLFVARAEGGNLIPLPLYNFNDIPCSAFVIATDGVPVAGDNFGAGIDPGEVVPPRGGCSNFMEWCDGVFGTENAEITNTVWYAFDAPASGGVEISTCGFATAFDTQIALYQAADCADYESYDLLAANDDFDADLDCNAQTIFASRLQRCGLAPGQTYYIQIDGYAGGTGNFELIVLPLPDNSCSARVQFVHNSADISAAVVDIRINGDFTEPEMDNLPFRTATPTYDVLGGQPIDITVSAGNSVDGTDPFLFLEGITFEAGGSYQVIVQGIASDAGYAPGSDIAPLEAVIIDGYIETIASPVNTFLAVVHGTTDAPAVDVDEQFIIGNEIFGNLAYGNFDGYSSVPLNNDYVLALTAAGQSDIIASYSLPLSDLNLGGKATTIFASGFFDTQANSNGSEFGLWISSPTGGPLIPLSNVTSVREREAVSGLKTYPNPADGGFTLEFSSSTNESVQMDVFNVHGQQIESSNYPSQQTQQRTIATDAWPAGVYTVVLSNTQGRNATRVVVIH